MELLIAGEYYFRDIRIFVNGTGVLLAVAVIRQGGQTTIRDMTAEVLGGRLLREIEVTSLEDVSFWIAVWLLDILRRRRDVVIDRAELS